MSSLELMTRRRFVGQVIAKSGAAVWAGQAAVALASDDDAGKPNTALFRMGAATQLINPEVDAFVQGAGVAKRATGIRDNLEANGLFLSDGTTQIFLISCALAAIESPRVAKMREAISQATGIPPCVCVQVIKTLRGGPSVLKTNYLMPIDEAYLDRLQGWLVKLAGRTVESASTASRARARPSGSRPASTCPRTSPTTWLPCAQCWRARRSCWSSPARRARRASPPCSRCGFA